MTTPKEQEKDPLIEILDVENQILIDSYSREAMFTLIFDPPIAKEVVSHRSGTIDLVRFPSEEKINDVEKRELIFIKPSSQLILEVGYHNVRFQTRGLIYKNAEGKESSAFVILEAGRGEKSKQRIVEWLEILVAVIEENLETGKTPKSEVTAKELKRLIKALTEEDTEVYYDADMWGELSPHSNLF